VVDKGESPEARARGKGLRANHVLVSSFDGKVVGAWELPVFGSQGCTFEPVRAGR
jgi:hypothetical protein